MMVEPFGAISVLNWIILDGVCKVTNNILIEKGFAVPGEGCIKVVAGCRRVGEKRVADAEVVNTLIYKRI